MRRCGVSRSSDRTVAFTGLAVLAATAVVARRREIHPTEHHVFRALNDVPQPVVLPLTVTMQAGSLAAVYVVAAGALLWRKPRLAATIAATGTGVWGGCKVVKRFVGRGRPGAHLEDVTVLGSPQSGTSPARCAGAAGSGAASHRTSPGTTERNAPRHVGDGGQPRHVEREPELAVHRVAGPQQPPVLAFHRSRHPPVKQRARSTVIRRRDRIHPR